MCCLFESVKMCQISDSQTVVYSQYFSCQLMFLCNKVSDNLETEGAIFYLTFTSILDSYLLISSLP